METKPCTFKGFEDLYLINSDGSVYSVRKKRMLIPRENNVTYKYLYIALTGHNGQSLRTSIHRVIAFHFIGPCPEGCEVNHKDLDRSNNDISNLEYITHQQNILHARQLRPWASGRIKGYKAREESKRKMAERKYKKVLLFNDSQEVICKSIEDATLYLKTYRRKVYTYQNTNRLLNGFKIKVLD